MKKYLAEFFDRYNFSSDASAQLLEAYEVLEKYEAFASLVERFYVDETLGVKDIDAVLNEIIEQSGIHPHKVKYLYYCCLTRELPRKYAEAGIPESIMWDSLADLKYKADECIEVHGFPGFFACGWFYGFFRLRLFKLGRLEFCVDPYKGDDLVLGDTVIKNGDRVISIHIPSSGESFDTAARYDAYDKAYHFFREVKHEDVCAFMCSSWLLFPEHYNMLKPTSNIISFMNDFRIISSGIYNDKRSELWRFFGHHAAKPFEELPRTNSLWKAYAELLCAGKDVGYGKGLFVWDPINKITVK